jgi:hypothetical protein
VLAGYLYAVRSPWSFPLLYTPYLHAPVGMSVVWSDVMPIVGLTGKAIHTVTGETVNLLGVYTLACFVLPGPAVTWALAAARVRNLVAMAAGTVFAVTMPILLWRWGHLASCAQFLIPGALALYLHTVPMRRRWTFAALWCGYLLLCLCFNNYLFVMAGAVFAAALAQRWLDGTDDWRGSAVVAAAAFLSVLLCMIALGFIGNALRGAGSFGFGYFSMNLLSPVYPQRSGLLPGFDGVLDATGGQYEGFAWLGAGFLLASLFALPLLVRWLRANWWRHAMLLVVLAGCVLAALSPRIFAGDALLVDLPLPAYLARGGAALHGAPRQAAGAGGRAAGFAGPAGGRHRALAPVDRRQRPGAVSAGVRSRTVERAGGAGGRHQGLSDPCLRPERDTEALQTGEHGAHAGRRHRGRAGSHQQLLSRPPEGRLRGRAPGARDGGPEAGHSLFLPRRARAGAGADWRRGTGARLRFSGRGAVLLHSRERRLGQVPRRAFRACNN